MTLRMKAFALFVTLAVATQVGLGVWQWQRMGEKRAMIAAIEASAKAPPVDLAAAKLWDRVEVTGRYLHENTAYVRSSRPEPKPGERDAQGRVPASGFGVLVLTPFVTRLCTTSAPCSLETIYVSRGFLPTEPNGRIPAFDRPDEPVTIRGFLRASESATLFQPGNDPARDVWFHRSVAEMAVRAGLFRAGEPGRYQRFIDREAIPGEIKPPYGVAIGDFLRAIPNNHFQYALTWWGLALTSLGVSLAFLMGRRKRRTPDTAA